MCEAPHQVAELHRHRVSHAEPRTTVSDSRSDSDLLVELVGGVRASAAGYPSPSSPPVAAVLARPGRVIFQKMQAEDPRRPARWFLKTGGCGRRCRTDQRSETRLMRPYARPGDVVALPKIRF